MRKSLQFLLCACMLFCTCLMSGCKKDSVKEELMAAIEKTNTASSYHIDLTENNKNETTYVLEDESTLKENNDYDTITSANYYVENEKVNYYEQDNYSDGGLFVMIVKDGYGKNFHSEEGKNTLVANDEELEDYSSLSPTGQYLYETWLNDFEKYAEYVKEERGDETVIRVNINDLEGLSASETDMYYKNYGASISYDSFSLCYHLNESGYITALEGNYSYQTEEIYEMATDLGYKKPVSRIKQDFTIKTNLALSKYNEEIKIDFSLLENK